MTTKRLALLALGDSEIMQLLHNAQGGALLGLAGLPDDARVERIHYDPTRRAFLVLLESATFEEVAEGMMPKTIFPEFSIAQRTELRWFAGEMEKKLAKHDHDRDGWLGVPATNLFRLMGEHEAKLLGSVVEGDHEKIIGAAADVANYCLMIADNALWDKTIREAEDQHGQPATDQAPR